MKIDAKIQFTCRGRIWIISPSFDSWAKVWEFISTIEGDLHSVELVDVSNKNQEYWLGKIGDPKDW